MTRLVVVASPGEKRARALAAAIERAGVDATWIPWGDAVADPARVGAAGAPGDWLRVDSPGSDVETWHALARRGGFDGHVPAGAWRPGRAWFAGLCATLDAIDAATPHLVATHPHVRAMTDKLVCQQRLEAAGVPVPPAFEAPPSASTLRDWLDDLGWAQVFVKPRWGSSGAGVLAWRRGPHGRERVVTTAVLVGGRADGGVGGALRGGPAPPPQEEHLQNDKHLRAYTDARSVDRLVGTVLADGAVVQRWIPKAGAEGGPFDLRVVVIDGRVAQRIGRVGRGPVTNLHLDAARADPDALLAPFPGAAGRVAEVCVAAAACFPGHRCVGVDVMIDPGGRPYVLECNAWGDYLPGLLLDGLDTYDRQLRGLLGGGS